MRQIREKCALSFLSLHREKVQFSGSDFGRCIQYADRFYFFRVGVACQIARLSKWQLHGMFFGATRFHFQKYRKHSTISGFKIAFGENTACHS